MLQIRGNRSRGEFIPDAHKNCSNKLKKQNQTKPTNSYESVLSLHSKSKCGWGSSHALTWKNTKQQRINHTHREKGWRTAALTQCFACFYHIWPLLFHHPLCWCLFLRPPSVEMRQRWPQPRGTAVKTITLLPPSARCLPVEWASRSDVTRNLTRVGVFFPLLTWDFKWFYRPFWFIYTKIRWWQRHWRSQPH